MAIEAYWQSSILAKATRSPLGVTTAMHIGQPRLVASASAASAAFFAWSSLMVSPYGMKAAFSATVSFGLAGARGYFATTTPHIFTYSPADKSSNGPPL